ncbi:MAG: hypothetical protein AVO35_04400 [Candidatus Aegiribacteria sp. MLS_C]|nr:MAG: hypothetical protein AVO35_04400 [Candidatus Aegiribacteria sp. MLS_C]
MPAIITSMALLGCGGGEPEVAQESSPRDPVLVEHGPTGNFAVEPVPSRTLVLRWEGEGAGSVDSVAALSGDRLMAGDTLCTVVMDIGAVLLERLEMELDMATARLSASPSDSLLLLRVDSLAGLVDSLERAGAEPFLSPLEGTLVEMHAGRGDRVTPGMVLATVSIAGRELFTVHPPEGAMIDHWPPGDDSAAFVEELAGYAVYSGDEEYIRRLFAGIVAVDRIGVFESGMSSYLITEAGDTVAVVRMGVNSGGSMLVLPESAIEGCLRTWTGE